ncbi:MAG: hypothetical protein HMLIMOIP_002187 [Candidatus Nitrosomirales archaeon]
MSFLEHLFLLNFDTALLLKLAQQFSFVTYSIVIAIGVTQGRILGGAIVERFPRMLSNARLMSMLLFALFASNAIVNVVKFAIPEKINIAQIFDAPSQELLSLFIKLVGLNAGAGAIIGFSLTVLILILMRFTTLKAYNGSFVFIISVIMIVAISAIKLSDYTPTAFEIIVYALYQAGMTAGIIWGTRIKLSSQDLRFRYFRERWIGKQEF